MSVVTKNTNNGVLLQAQADMAQTDPTQPDYVLNQPKINKQVQADWNQLNNLAPDFIKHKPSNSSPGTQVNSDWNATSGVAQILNKPTLTGVVTSMPIASSVGILANGSDMTILLNAVFASPLYSGIVMDYSAPAAVTITGTLNCQGKKIFFQPGSYFTGAGTINNAVLAGSYVNKFFDTSITLTNVVSATDVFSAMWYGAVGDGATDDIAALQRASDMAIANTNTLTRNFYVPSKPYKITKPWIFYNWNGTTYDQMYLNVIGGKRVGMSTLKGIPRIIAPFSDKFIVGLQNATSGSFEGFSVEGPFVYNPPDGNTFVNTTFASASGGTVRTNHLSPSACICIDPFTNGQQPAAGDGYPGMDGQAGSFNWYRGNNSNSGTTHFLIKGCSLQGEAVGVMYTPNGFTQQGEDCRIEDCEMRYVESGLAYGQAQSDNCSAARIRMWYSIWTVVDNQKYGATGGYASLSDFNIAGNVNTLFNLKTGKGFTINNFYAESFFTFGQVNVGFGSAVFTGCNFDFNQAIVSQPQYHLNTCSNLIFYGCRFRYFDDQYNKRMRIYQPVNLQFIGGFLDAPPYVISESSNQHHSVSYENVQVGTNAILGMKNDSYYYEAGATVIIPWGKFKIQNTVGQDVGGPVNPTIYYNYDVTSFDRSFANIATGVTITPDGSRNASFTSSFNYLLQINDICIDSITGNVLGRISNIVGTTITISEIPINITTGSYTIQHVYYLTHLNMFIGDINSSTSITNVCPLNYGFLNTFAAGFRFDHPAFPKGTSIVSYNSGTQVLTMSAAATKTAVRQNFLNGNPEVQITSITAPGAASINTYPTPIPTGATWTEQMTTLTSSVYLPVVWKFFKGGYLNATALGGFGTPANYQAQFNIKPEIWFDGTNFQAYNAAANTWTTL